MSNNNGTVDQETPPILDSRDEETLKRDQDRARDDAGPAQGFDESQLRMQAQIEHMEEVANKLSGALTQLTEALKRNPQAVAAMGGTPARDLSDPPGHDPMVLDRAIELSKLTKRKLDNGDVAYGIRLGMDTLKYELGPGRDAFIERNLTTAHPHIEVVGTGEHHIEAAMKQAAHRWGQDVAIHFDPLGKDAQKIVRHAVTQGLNLVNKDPRVRDMVIAERERQNNPLLRGRSLDEILIEPAGGQGRGDRTVRA